MLEDAARYQTLQEQQQQEARKFRDASAWTHIAYIVDPTESTEANRVMTAQAHFATVTYRRSESNNSANSLWNNHIQTQTQLRSVESTQGHAEKQKQAYDRAKNAQTCTS